MESVGSHYWGLGGVGLGQHRKRKKKQKSNERGAGCSCKRGDLGDRLPESRDSVTWLERVKGELPLCTRGVRPFHQRGLQVFGEHKRDWSGKCLEGASTRKRKTSALSGGKRTERVKKDRGKEKKFKKSNTRRHLPGEGSQYKKTKEGKVSMWGKTIFPLL